MKADTLRYKLERLPDVRVFFEDLSDPKRWLEVTDVYFDEVARVVKIIHRSE